MVSSLIKCPQCGAEFEASEALTHQIEEKVVADLEAKHLLRIEEEKQKAGKELLEEKERNKKLAIQLTELLDQMRVLKRKDEERDMEMKKKLMDEEEKIRVEVRKKSLEEHELKDREKDQKLREALEQIETLKTKMQQGSQQTQGETLELQLEEMLRSEFPQDEISEVKKGQRGADIAQVVVDKLGRRCGTILWESKNAQWSEGWVAKLKEDQRQAKADLAVLVSVHLPEKLETFTYRAGVWVVSWKHFLPLALALRFNLVSIYHERQTAQGRDEKMQILYQYLTGTEFKHRVEGIVDAFTVLQEELEREKRWFGTKWARQEKEIRKVIDHTHGMYGDLQGVIGNSLPEIKSLELPEEVE